MNTHDHSASPRIELRAYEAALPQLLPKHDGDFVVIHGDKLVEYFETYAEALTWAYEKYDLQPFFVKRVSSEQNIVHYTRDLGPCR